jgi:hypothetical protein
MDPSIMKNKIFSTLPVNDSSEYNKEILHMILDILQDVAIELMSSFSSKEERTNFQSQFSNADGYNTLLYVLSVYEDKINKERICIVLGLFYDCIMVPEEGKIVINILINVLREYSTKKLEMSFVYHLVDVLGALLNITVNVNNKQTVYDKGILNTLLPLIETSKGSVLGKAVNVLGNIAAISSLDVVNGIIKADVFDILHKRLVDMSPEPPKRMVAGDYFCVSRIIMLVNNLLISNPSGAKPFLDSPLILVLNLTLESSMSLLDTSSDENLENISRFTELSENRKRLEEGGVKYALVTIFNIAYYGSTQSEYRKGNLSKERFGENNKFNTLVGMCKFFISQQPSSRKQKGMTNNISIAVCKLLKSPIVLSYY